jgi:hypothetical protein
MALKWRDSSHIAKSKVDADVALIELERIRIEYGGKLKPVNILKESEPKEAVLHPMFEWRNSVAANEYRLWQARELARSVRVEIRHADGKTEEFPYYVNIRTDNDEGKKESYYQSTEIAVTRPDEWFSALAAAQAKVSQARKSLDELERIAHGSEDSDRLARLAIAAKALDTAAEALRH